MTLDATLASGDAVLAILELALLLLFWIRLAGSVVIDISRRRTTSENIDERDPKLRVISASKYGEPEVLRLEERPVPRPNPDEALIAVKAAGINLTDTYRRRGMNASHPLPLALGLDGAGEVVAVGDRSTASVGDRVAWERVQGSYAEFLTVPSEHLIPIPDSVSFETAACRPPLHRLERVFTPIAADCS